MNIPMLKLYLLGSFRATLGGQELVRFRSDRARALFAYLALEGNRPIPRPQLADLLWHGYSPERASDSLRVTLSNLRKVVSPLNLFRTTFRTVQFCSDHPYFWCDALALVQPPSGLDGNLFEPLTHHRDWSHGPQFLAGFDQIDSEPFQVWLQEQRSVYQQFVAHVAQQRQDEHSPGAAVITVPTPVAADSGQPLAGPISKDEPPALLALPAAHPAPLPRHEWALIPDMGAFYGRHPELSQLEQWVLGERCRLVSILGMGGQGKTALVARLLHRLLPKPGAAAATPLRHQEFAHVIWCSLVNAPPLAEVLQSWLETLTGLPANKLPTQLDQQLDRLVHELGRQRCLLVLDNGESILAAGERAGSYRPGYEVYGRLFQRLAESSHRSCLLLTSREQPREFSLLEPGNRNVQTLRLDGLAVEVGQEMLQAIGLSGDPAVMRDLVQRYSGNPLALKLVAVTVQELFAGDIAAFLAQETLVFDNIRDVFDQHFARLPAMERDLLYWLAMEREPVPITALYDNLIQPPVQREVLESLRSLQRRSLLEQVGDHFHLQNVIIEYLTDRLAEAPSQEILDFGF